MSRKKKKERNESRSINLDRRLTLQSIHSKPPATPLVLLRESSVLKLVHEHSSQNLRDQAAGSVERDAVNIAEAIVELNLGHVGSELQQRLPEVGFLGSDLLAVAVAGDLDGTGQRQAGEGLLGGEDAAEVEGLEVEVGCGAVVVVGAELGLLVSEVFALVMV